MSRSGQGVLRLGRRRITWRFRGRGPAGTVAWADVIDWSVGRDTRLGVARHTHCLTLTFPDGRLWLQTRGPWGSLDLARARRVLAGAVASTPPGVTDGRPRTR